MINKFLQERLNKRHQENSFRKLGITLSLIDFTSNDYLGLAQSERMFKSGSLKTEPSLLPEEVPG
ncbi:MAG TPA: hypothetical protein VFU05_16365 [Cyclobacteriaceae bacterium]|nr:hypothetical protein [Cyclobacteriaceae bacterium]